LHKSRRAAHGPRGEETGARDTAHGPRGSWRRTTKGAGAGAGQILNPKLEMLNKFE